MMSPRFPLYVLGCGFCAEFRPPKQLAFSPYRASLVS